MNNSPITEAVGTGTRDDPIIFVEIPDLPPRFQLPILIADPNSDGLILNTVSIVRQPTPTPLEEFIDDLFEESDEEDQQDGDSSSDFSAHDEVDGREFYAKKARFGGHITDDEPVTEEEEEVEGCFNCGAVMNGQYNKQGEFRCVCGFNASRISAFTVCQVCKCNTYSTTNQLCGKTYCRNPTLTPTGLYQESEKRPCTRIRDPSIMVCEECGGLTADCDCE